MSKATQLIQRWIDDVNECPSIEAWAKEIDPNCRIDGFLYTDVKRVIFSDGSVAVHANDCLKLGKAR